MDESVVVSPDSKSAQQQVDPVVSRAKFNRELATFKKVKEYNRQRGIILFDAEFPYMKLAFYAYRITPLILAFAIKLDFTNYDLEAPSLKFIDFLLEKELTRPELNIQLLRQQSIQPPGQQAEGIINTSPLDLIQFHTPGLVPFVCIPGIREYHEHPAHSNDPWLSHRRKGEGTLGFIIDQLHKYGSEPLNGIMPNMANIQQINPAGMMVQFQGIVFSRDKIPL
ncbi:MAG: hypothetical protein KGZ74_05755 [Chitinophagaceae bacterium]|nr:hypothetical protein [Chitinophagaceae bacterium]